MGLQEVGAYTEVIDAKSGEVKDYRIVKVTDAKWALTTMTERC